MTWQRDFTKWRGTPEFRRRYLDSRNREEERQNAAAYRLHLRDQHDEGRHASPVQGCDFCKREA